MGLIPLKKNIELWSPLFDRGSIVTCKNAKIQIRPKPLIKVLFFLLIIFGSACSSTSWVVVNEEETDRGDSELLSSDYYFESSGSVTPNQPIVNFQLKAVNTYEYNRRIKTERYIQQYKPRLGYVMAGIAGAGLSYYAAFSDNLIKNSSDPQKYALAGTGTALVMLSFMNMEPVGSPTKTGETRLLRKSGTVTEVDTVNGRPYSSDPPFISISYGGDTLMGKTEWSFNRNRLSVNLVEEINAENLDPESDAPIVINVNYDDIKYTREVSVSSVFEQFVVVSAQITALRNTPDINSDNVLTDLAQGSQLKLVSQEGEWSKVLYGISDNWVLSKDVYIILRPSEFAADLSVITVANVPFGAVDVEQNIPAKGTNSFGSAALLITNQAYEGDFSERVYADRDAQLMETYFKQTLGIRDGKIISGTDIQNNRQLQRTSQRLSNTLARSDSSLTVYLSGYAEVRDSKIYLFGSNEAGQEPELIDLNRLFNSINELSLKSLVVFADLDFISNDEEQAALNDMAEIVTQEIPESAIIFSSYTDQRSGMYSSTDGEQNRHSIFTYYLAEAMKQGNIRVRDIYNHLQRNVSFTSRRLYDRPQNVSIYGNPDISLTE